MLQRILSGGQTGVDRAGLDAAIETGLPIGGWCPKERWSEDGRIPDRYDLAKTPLADAAQRTEWNIRDSDGTLVLTFGEPMGGTALTLRLAREHRKPSHVVDLGGHPDPEAAMAWLEENGIRVLNVAGPRESECPGIHERAATFLERLFALGGRRRLAPED